MKRMSLASGLITVLLFGIQLSVLPTAPAAPLGPGQGDGEKGARDLQIQKAYGNLPLSFIKTRPIVIDPVLVYSTYLGGSDTELGTEIAVDGAGNAYLMGFTLSTDFPATPGSHDPTPNGGWDVVVAKVNGTGSGLVYSTYLSINGNPDIVPAKAGNHDKE